MSYGTTLTILEPGYAVGYETFDARYPGKSAILKHQSACGGRSMEQVHLGQDKVMGFIRQRLSEVNGEATEDMPVARYKKGNYQGKGEVRGTDGEFRKLSKRHTVTRLGYPTGSYLNKGYTKKPRLLNKPQTIA